MKNKMKPKETQAYSLANNGIKMFLVEQFWLVKIAVTKQLMLET